MLVPTRVVSARQARKKPRRAERIAASASADRCSALPCPYWCPGSAVGRRRDGEKRQQRGDEIRPGVKRLQMSRGCGTRARRQLERDEDDRGGDRDEAVRRRGSTRASETECRYRLPRKGLLALDRLEERLKLPSPKPRAPCRSITSKKSVGRSCAVFVKIWRR